MDIKLYNKVLLKDKREGIVIEIYETNKAYEIEFMVDDTGEYPEYETDTIKHEGIEKIIEDSMKIVTGITKQEMKKLVDEATKTTPSTYRFRINIDNKEYDAKLYCHVIYDGRTARNNMTGMLEYSLENKKTINRIEVYNFTDFEKIVEKLNDIFKIDEDDYYLEETERWITGNNKITFIAVNTNKF